MGEIEGQSPDPSKDKEGKKSKAGYDHIPIITAGDDAHIRSNFVEINQPDSDSFPWEVEYINSAREDCGVIPNWIEERVRSALESEFELESVGLTVELVMFPYYEDENELDKEFARVLVSFRNSDNSYRLPLGDCSYNSEQFIGVALDVQTQWNTDKEASRRPQLVIPRDLFETEIKFAKSAQAHPALQYEIRQIIAEAVQDDFLAHGVAAPEFFQIVTSSVSEQDGCCSFYYYELGGEERVFIVHLTHNESRILSSSLYKYNETMIPKNAGLYGSLNAPPEVIFKEAAIDRDATTFLKGTAAEIEELLKDELAEYIQGYELTVWAAHQNDNRTFVLVTLYDSERRNYKLLVDSKDGQCFESKVPIARWVSFESDREGIHLGETCITGSAARQFVNQFRRFPNDHALSSVALDVVRTKRGDQGITIENCRFGGTREPSSRVCYDLLFKCSDRSEVGVTLEWRPQTGVFTLQAAEFVI